METYIQVEEDKIEEEISHIERMFGDKLKYMEVLKDHGE
jgi:hypothetical protein